MKKQRVGVYTRISTIKNQSTAPQESELREFASRRGWEIVRVYSDRGISGAVSKRPALSELMADCRRRKLDIVLVWKFDRFARSLKHLVEALEEFKRLGVDFISATEGIDTTSAGGELIFQIFGSIAQFERGLISERVKSGLAHAVRMGKRLGRPPAKELTAGEIKQIQLQRSKGATLREISTRFAIPVSCAYRVTLRRVSKHLVKNGHARGGK